ncbi:MAG: dihydroorotase [Bacteroidetes bacterium]|nr:dihydroorotase [Bacteroidota bacterium]
MNSWLIRNATLVNEGTIQVADVRIENGIITQTGNALPAGKEPVYDATGLHLLPGVIDDQVHFREPGLTHKGNIYSESRAAAAGGVTSFMEMPNTHPPTLNQERLEEKYGIAARTSLVNYAFFMGASNDNLDEVLRTPANRVAGIKIFMGSSTGNMLVDNAEVLDKLFARVNCLIAVHCEDEATVRANMAQWKETYGEQVPMDQHPLIRSREACYRSSSLAISLAQKHNTRLHILHISTAEELALFRNDIPLTEKRITAEVCVHHLWFAREDYAHLGSHIKWNPAVKETGDREALWQALLDDRLDVVATDHAPHTAAEKTLPYFQCPSGGPLIQHSLQAMLQASREGKIPLTRVVEKMCHAPATLFQVYKRGYIRPGYYADLVLADLNKPYTVSPDNVLYRCGWSPFMGHTFPATIQTTFVNGTPVWHHGQLQESQAAMRLAFDRP